MSHLKKIIVIEVEHNEHLNTFGASVLLCHRPASLRESQGIGGATVIQLEEWLVDQVREFHLLVPAIMKEIHSAKR